MKRRWSLYVDATMGRLFGTPTRRRLLENFVSLSALQALNYILPLVTVPYLVRVLGPEKFGLVAFANATAAYFGILIDYGFNLSATRKISIVREDKAKRSEIFNAVILVRSGLMLVGLAILTGLLMSVRLFRSDWPVYLLAFGTPAANVLSLAWFFQGMERMKFVTLLNFLARVAFTVAIFIFVQSQADYHLVPLINSLGYLASGVLGIFLARWYFDIRLAFPGTSTIIEMVKDGWHIFVSTAAMSLYTVSNTFILGLFTNNAIVGYYSAAEKLIAAVTAAFAPVSRTIYPYISKLSVTSKDRALQLIRRIERWVAVTSLVVSLALLVFAAPVVRVLFGSQYQASVIVVQIQAFLPCIIGVATVYANLFLLGFGYSAQWSRIIIVSSLLSIVLGISFIGILSLAHYGAAAARLITECIVFSWSYVAYRRKVCYAHR